MTLGRSGFSRIVTSRLKNGLMTDLAPAVCPTLLDHEGSGLFAHTSVDHSRQALGSGWRKSHFCRQPAYETTTSCHQSLPETRTQSFGDQSFPAGIFSSLTSKDALSSLCGFTLLCGIPAYQDINPNYKISVIPACF